MERRIGLEQEFFLVDSTGRTSDRADEFLALCRETASREGLDPEVFVGECTESMVEINTPPAYTVEELAGSYLASLDLALRAGQELDIRLYPLSTYPLPLTPALRNELSYELQARTVGRTRFLHAARCVGVHLHLELPAGTVDPDTIISPKASAAVREELLNLYNLATALDPALVALTRASPFYEGRAPGLAVRPTSGEVFWLVLPTVSARAFSLALYHFAEWVGAGKDKKRILLALDQAGWHTGGEVGVPEGIELEFLPARSPELMPAERLWPLVNERVANRPFEDLDGLEEALVERCLALSEQPDLLRGCTGYHWWPGAA